ncbi:MAG: O-antigen ligase family protein [Myxococcales bacterium]|nr:O-antigen ligase family protein [Myxococcales bacterium]
MSGRSSSARTSATHVAWGLVALVALAPLALGGTRADAQLLLALCALALLGALAWVRRSVGLRLPWPLWGPLALVALGVVQLVPLGVGLLDALSPVAADLRALSLADLGAYDDRRHPLSLDPPATWVALFHQLAFVAVAVVAANLGRYRGRIVAALALTGAALSIIGVAHHVAGAERILGVFGLADGKPLEGFFSTFVNPNTLSSALVLSTLVSLGLVVRAQNERQQTLWLTCGGLCALGVLWSESRGGQLALLIGLIVFAALAHARGPTDTAEGARRQARALATAALGVALVGVALAVWLQHDWQALLLDPAQDQKTAFWRDAVGLVRDFWLTGAGRGTFGLVFPHYQTVMLSGTVSHPENIGLQLATEWGVAGAVIGLVAGVGGWWYALRGIGRETRPVHWGLLAGLAAVGLHQLVDFGFEAAGLSLPVAAALGLAIGARAHDRGPLGSRTRRTARAALVVAALGAGVLVVRAGPILGAQADRALDDVAAAPADADAIEAVGRRLALDHPADPLLPLNVANRLAQLPAVPLARTLRWINRALALDPTGGAPHLLAARVLDTAGRPGQAAVEFRLTLQRMPWARGRLLDEILQRFRAPRHLAQAVPPTADGHHWLVSALLGAGDPAHARAVLSWMLVEHPDDVELRRGLAQACARLEDHACVRREGGWLVERHGDLGGHALLARVLVAEGDGEGARALLHHGERSGGLDDRAFLRTAAELYVQLGDPLAARPLVDRLLERLRDEPRAMGTAFALRARVSIALKDDTAALHDWRRALARHPAPGYALAAAQTALRLGRPEEARALLDDAVKRWPEVESLRALRAQQSARPRP